MSGSKRRLVSAAPEVILKIIVYMRQTEACMRWKVLVLKPLADITWTLVSASDTTKRIWIFEKRMKKFISRESKGKVRIDQGMSSGLRSRCLVYGMCACIKIITSPTCTSLFTIISFIISLRRLFFSVILCKLVRLSQYVSRSRFTVVLCPGMR